MEIIKDFGGIAGIAGISLGVFLFLFKDIIAKNIYPRMTREHGYKTIRLVILLTWTIAIIGIGIWTFFEYLKTNNATNSSKLVPSNDSLKNNEHFEKKQTNHLNESTKSKANSEKKNDRINSESFCRILTNSKYSRAKVFIDKEQAILIDKFGSTRIIKLPSKPDKTYLITLVNGIDTIYSEKHFLKLDTNNIVISRI